MLFFVAASGPHYPNGRPGHCHEAREHFRIWYAWEPAFSRGWHLCFICPGWHVKNHMMCFKSLFLNKWNAYFLIQCNITFSFFFFRASSLFTIPSPKIINPIAMHVFLKAIKMSLNSKAIKLHAHTHAHTHTGRSLDFLEIWHFY